MGGDSKTWLCPKGTSSLKEGKILIRIRDPNPIWKTCTLGVWKSPVSQPPTPNPSLEFRKEHDFYIFISSLGLERGLGKKFKGGGLSRASLVYSEEIW